MKRQTLCPFSAASAQFDTAENSDARFYASDACGRYYVDRQLLFEPAFKEPITVEKITQGHLNCAHRSLELERQGLRAYWVYAHEYEARKNQFLVTRTMPNVVVCPYETVRDEPVEHADKPVILLQEFSKKLATRRAYARFFVTPEDQVWSKICDGDELVSILLSLESDGYLKIDLPLDTGNRERVLKQRVFETEIEMTVRGWHHLKERNTYPNSNKVFIATQFAWPIDDEIRAESVLAIKRACKSHGYDADIVTQNHTGQITDRIMSEIRASRFVIAELTYNNRGVYFEAGFARGIGRPVFHVVKDGFTSGADSDGRRIHFDIQQVMFKTWSTPIELEEKLRDWIGSVIGPFAK